LGGRPGTQALKFGRRESPLSCINEPGSSPLSTRLAELGKLDEGQYLHRSLYQSDRDLVDGADVGKVQ